jgi:hypothetical protein
MAKNKIIFGVAALLVVIVAIGVLMRKPSGASNKFSFEDSPRAIFSDLKFAASQKPQLARSPSGVLSVLAVADTQGRKRLVYARSQDDGDHFEKPIGISDEKSSVIASGENVPSLVQVTNGIYATWQETTPEGRHRIMFARSSDMGVSFEKPVEVVGKNFTSFNGFSTMNAAPNGDVYVAWLDGRDQPEPEGTLSLYLARSSDGGASFTTNTRIALGACPCCRPAIAFGKGDRVFLAWRKVFDGDIRDVVLASSNDGGKTFSAPQKVGDDKWVLHGCPDSGPSMASIGNRLYIAWYSEGNHTSGIRITVSDDGGKTFSFPDLASRGVFNANHPQLSVFDTDHVLLTFQGRRQLEKQEHWTPLQVFVSSLDPLGQAAPAEPLPSLNNSAMYPSTLSAGPDRIFVAWTEVSGNTSVELCRGTAH